MFIGMSLFDFQQRFNTSQDCIDYLSKSSGRKATVVAIVPLRSAEQETLERTSVACNAVITNQ